MRKRSLNWLCRRPIAHRGLHDIARGIVENTATAFQRAAGAGYGIELDIQITADGEAVVFHDDTLQRLTHAQGPVRAMTLDELKHVAFVATNDRIQSLSEAFAQIDGRVPLIVEIKSLWDGDFTLARRAAYLAQRYKGRVALMSFDPAMVRAVRDAAPALVRGLVAARFGPAIGPANAALFRRLAMTHLLYAPLCRPDFISYDYTALRTLAPIVARSVFRLPLITWTVRNQQTADKVAFWADQITFEGFEPALDNQPP